MSIERELTPAQKQYFEKLDVDVLIDQELFSKPMSLLNKIRNGVKEKFFENAEQILGKWSCEILGNTHIKLDLKEEKYCFNSMDQDYYQFHMTPNYQDEFTDLSTCEKE